MPDLLAQLAPQRSTQYSDMVATLAEPELRLVLGKGIVAATASSLGGQPYLRLTLNGDLDPAQREALGRMAFTSAYFWIYDHICEVDGPLLQPIDVPESCVLPRALVETRRYRGKTNELFTQFLCNVCHQASAFCELPWSELRLFDPLAGGGTTLFVALTWGADVAGIDHATRDVESTAGFLQRFLQSEGIACRGKKERLRQLGTRWDLRIGRDGEQRCLLCAGDTVEASSLVQGFKPHLIVADLPYGIQHKGGLRDLVARGMPVWAELLRPGGAMALAWESSRYSRAAFAEQVASIPGLEVLQSPPYNALAHRVDRVIKRRDVLLVTKPR